MYGARAFLATYHAFPMPPRSFSMLCRASFLEFEVLFLLVEISIISHDTLLLRGRNKCVYRRRNGYYMGKDHKVIEEGRAHQARKERKTTTIP